MIEHITRLAVRAAEDLGGRLRRAGARARDWLADRFGFEISVTVNDKTREIRFGRADR